MPGARASARTARVVLILAAVALTYSAPPPQAPVFVSVLVYEPMADVEQLIENFLKFTESETRLLVHLNALQNYSHADVDTLEHSGRVLVNPERLAVVWGSPQISAAFLSNADLAASTLTANQIEAAIVVWVDSNMFWTRPCMEQYVRVHECTNYDRNVGLFPAGKPKNAATMAATRNGSTFSYNDHEGAFFRLTTLLNLHKEAFPLGYFGGLFHYPENWLFPSFGSHRGCTGGRLCRWAKNTGGAASQALHSPRPNEFSYKRVPRSLEVIAGISGTTVDGSRAGHSRPINATAAAALRQLFLDLQPPANHTCQTPRT